MKRTIPFIEVSMILPYVNVSLRYLSLSAIIFPMKRRDTSFMLGGSNYNIEIDTFQGDQMINCDEEFKCNDMNNQGYIF